MPEDGHNEPNNRLARAEEILATLIDHATLTDAQIARHTQQIEILRDSSKSLNADVKSLVAAIRDLIDRIPPANLR